MPRASGIRGDQPQARGTVRIRERDAVPLYGSLVPLAFTGLEALAAVDRPVVLGNERDLGGPAASRAHCIEAFPVAGALGFARVPAGLATDGLVLEALLGVEFLLARGEYEFSAAILAYQCLVLEHVFVFPLLIRFFSLPQTSADLVFDPTFAVRSSRYPACASHYAPSRGIEKPRTDLHLDRTMLTNALFRLRGSFRLRLASTCNHRPEVRYNFNYYRLSL